MRICSPNNLVLGIKDGGIKLIIPIPVVALSYETQCREDLRSEEAYEPVLGNIWKPFKENKWLNDNFERYLTSL